LMTALDIVNSDGSALDPKATLSFANQGKTPIYVAKAGKLVATIALADPIKPDAKEAIAAMLQRGIRVVLLTGDNPQTAQAVADQWASPK